ncbi:N-acetylmannosaminyltransferase [Desulfonispora thiosulfatigenes DSM 11270]|uniref:N-acetylglucosaminyldiphosphoundecaprenol N-acetyl-beta-D-mannosaminyltransferase n=1 Tax=Desulfonispora thiosulfatigenes DSM 11270 TaxID=656914 RepID=A0A1W1V4H6_DESTI|nr:WecB/TagA/CpsF family glycosyltransferase [Desulfonispora thiosulfatigenes]SMB88299.1 N-acetylmannosaminyltransferase [Desulfonispora thiosulfatigenes DSM 11270]
MRRRIYLLGSLVDKVNLKQALEKIEEFIESKTPHHVITANAEIIYTGRENKSLSRTLNKADLVTADGSGVMWASKYIKDPIEERVTGIDLLNAICKQAPKKGWKLYFLGGEPGIAEKAVLKVLELEPECQIVGYENGYFNEEETPKVIENIQKSAPDILFVALGAPRQEFWIREHLKELNVPVCIGVGGSFDVLAGKAQRAPEWMQNNSLEWLYRLYKEPWRYKRMLALPKFVLAVIGQKQKGEEDIQDEEKK